MPEAKVARSSQLRDERPQFGLIPEIDVSAYSVNAGLPIEYLVREAWSIADVLAELAGEGAELPLSPAKARLMETSLFQVRAILSAVTLQLSGAG